MVYRYKFSWNPETVLNNLKSGAKWLENDEVLSRLNAVVKLSTYYLGMSNLKYKLCYARCGAVWEYCILIFVISARET